MKQFYSYWDIKILFVTLLLFVTVLILKRNNLLMKQIMLIYVCISADLPNCVKSSFLLQAGVTCRNSPPLYPDTGPFLTLQTYPTLEL